MASGNGSNGHRPKVLEKVGEIGENVWGSQVVELDLPARLGVPQGLHRQPP